MPALLREISRFVKEHLVPCERRVEEQDRMPEELLARMRELGLFGMTIPSEYGGLGLGAEEEARVWFQLGQSSPAYRALLSTNNGIASHGLIVAGTEAQKSRYLPPLASGEMIGAFALTEPESGSDAGSLRTTARRDGDAYVVDGVKRFITNAPEAGLITVFARTSPDAPNAYAISAFLVDADLPGVRIGKPDRKMGQRGTHTADVILDGCRVRADAMLGAEGGGFLLALGILERARLNCAAVCVGVTERLIRDAVSYAKERKQFGRPIAEFQLIQAMLADSRAEAYAARCMVLDAARRWDAAAGKTFATTEIACAKLFASEMVSRVADRAMQIHGGAGYMKDYDVERLYRDVRLFRLYEGTSQIQQLLIATNMLQKAKDIAFD